MRSIGHPNPSETVIPGSAKGPQAGLNPACISKFKGREDVEAIDLLPAIPPPSYRP